MDYRLTGPISAYPNEYHRHPFFGDPSPELDYGCNDRLRCRKASTTSVLMLTVLKIPRYASLGELSHYSQGGMILGDSSRYVATPTAYYYLHRIRFLHKIVYPEYFFQTTRRRRTSAETFTPVLIPPLETASLQADSVPRTMPTQLVLLANVQRGHDYPRSEMASKFTSAVTNRPRAR